MYTKQCRYKCILNWYMHSTAKGVYIHVYIRGDVADHGFEPRSGKTKHYKIGICCFSAMHAALRRKSKNWLARNQNYMSEWSYVRKDMDVNEHERQFSD
jgi:hypothetical protein